MEITNLAPPRDRFTPYLTPECSFDEASYKRQAEAVPRPAPRRVAIVEDPLVKLGRDTIPAIIDHDLDDGVVRVRRDLHWTGS
jgi:hypothetical protein